MKRMTSVFLSAVMMLLSALPLSAASLDYTPSSSYKNGPYYKALTAVSLTGDYHKDLVAVAASQVGYRESDSASKLSGTSRGTSDYTEYGYRFNTNGQAYCACFVSYCARAAGIPTSVIANSINATADDFGVAWHERKDYTPSCGDLIIFDKEPYNLAAPRSAHGDHVGIVEYVQNNRVHTIEGNTSNNCVERCDYPLNDTNIKGYGTYGNASSSNEPANQTVATLRAHIGFKATLANNEKVYAYSDWGGNKVGRVYEDDVFTVNEIRYYEGAFWARISCPWSENGRSFNKTVYIKLKDIVPDLSYGVWNGWANCQITTYKHSDRGTQSGYVGNGDLVCVLCESNGSALVLYPLAGGGYKLGWIPA